MKERHLSKEGARWPRQGLQSKGAFCVKRKSVVCKCQWETRIPLMLPPAATESMVCGEKSPSLHCRPLKPEAGVPWGRAGVMKVRRQQTSLQNKEGLLWKGKEEELAMGMHRTVWRWRKPRKLALLRSGREMPLTSDSPNRGCSIIYSSRLDFSRAPPTV